MRDDKGERLQGPVRRRRRSRTRPTSRTSTRSGRTDSSRSSTSSTPTSCSRTRRPTSSAGAMPRGRAQVLVDDRATWSTRAASADGRPAAGRLNEDPRLFVAVPLQRAGPRSRSRTLVERIRARRAGGARRPLGPPRGAPPDPPVPRTDAGGRASPTSRPPSTAAAADAAPFEVRIAGAGRVSADRPAADAVARRRPTASTS